MINILIRTNNRPKYFQRCIDSIKMQTYKDYVIHIAHGPSDYYVADIMRGLPRRITEIPNRRHPGIDVLTMAVHGAKFFPANDQLNALLGKVPQNERYWIMFLDDDDFFTEDFSLAEIAAHAEKPNQVVFWPVNLKGKLVPKGLNYGNRPVKKDICSIGFCFNSTYIPLIHIAPYKQFDYRLADQLYSWCDSIWTDPNIALTAADNEGKGLKIDMR